MAERREKEQRWREERRRQDSSTHPGPSPSTSAADIETLPSPPVTDTSRPPTPDIRLPKSSSVRADHKGKKLRKSKAKEPDSIETLVEELLCPPTPDIREVIEPGLEELRELQSFGGSNSFLEFIE